MKTNSNSIYIIYIMGLLALLLSLIGCGESENRRSLSKAIYPTDHKLTMEERKSCSEIFLKRNEIEINNHLPYIEDYSVAKFRSPKDVAAKAVVLFGLLHVANKEKTAVEIADYFKEYNLMDYVSIKEREFLYKQELTEEDLMQMAWRVECLDVLLWSLNYSDSLSFPIVPVDIWKYKDLPDLKKDPTDWIYKARLRDTEEILNETDLIYRIHWAVRDASINGRPVPRILNEDVVIERHYALNWLTMYAEDWDDITTDT